MFTYYRMYAVRVSFPCFFPPFFFLIIIRSCCPWCEA